MGMTICCKSRYRTQSYCCAVLYGFIGLAERPDHIQNASRFHKGLTTTIIPSASIFPDQSAITRVDSFFYVKMVIQDVKRILTILITTVVGPPSLHHKKRAHTVNGPLNYVVKKVEHANALQWYSWTRAQQGRLRCRYCLGCMFETFLCTAEDVCRSGAEHV